MACGCPAGYSFNVSTGLCEQIVTSVISPGATPASVPTICPLEENMALGTAVYPTITPNQFPLVGQSTLSPSFVDVLANTVTPVGTILSGSLWVGGSIFNGLLNQRGVGLPPTLNTWYGVNRCVTVNPGDIISFALSAKTQFRLYIDGVLAVIHQPVLPIKANDYLHVFPLQLPAGSHTFRAEALGAVSYPCNGVLAYGNFLVEVYSNVTAAILLAITSQGTLNGFYASTNGSIPLLTAGSTFDVSSNIALGQAYCPTGYMNACTVGQFNCITINTLPYVPCCFSLTDCIGGAVIKTTTDLSDYVGHVIKIAEQPGCFIVAFNSDVDCVGAIPIALPAMSDVFEDCPTCTQVFYKLTDCAGNLPDIVTITDFSASIGGVVKIEGFDGICWIPTVTTSIPFPADVTKVADFATCEICSFVPPPPIPTPPFYQLHALGLRTRAIQPGYDSEHCSVDFIERVNCNFSQQVYPKLLEQKYGVESCVEDEYDKWFIKKQILELNLIDNPAFCKCIPCLAPCGVSLTFQEFYPITDTSPVVSEASLQFTPQDLPAPSDPNADIMYQSDPTYN